MNSVRQMRYNKMLNSFRTKQIGACIGVTARDWQLLVRLRHAVDGYCTCVTCGAIQHYKDMDAGHFLPNIAANRSVTFHPWNCYPQCKHCNSWGNGQQNQYRKFLESEIGQDGLATLEKIKNETKKWTREELVEMRLEFRDEIKRLTPG